MEVEICIYPIYLFPTLLLLKGMFFRAQPPDNGVRDVREAADAPPGAEESQERGRILRPTGKYTQYNLYGTDYDVRYFVCVRLLVGMSVCVLFRTIPKFPWCPL